MESKRTDLAPIYAALRDAAIVLKFSDSVNVTAQDLVSGIPRGAPRPVSPTGVARLSARRGTTDRTIYAHIRKLCALGLVTNACLDGGRRVCVRDQTGQIAALHGIDFTPLLGRAPELRAAVEDMRETESRRVILRSRISSMRRSIRSLLPTETCAAHSASWARLPRRIAHLSLERLQAMAMQVQALLAAILEARKEDDDRSEEIDRPYTTLQKLTDPCNAECPASGSTPAHKPIRRHAHGLDRISVRQVMMAAPEDWMIIMRQRGRPSLDALVDVAFQRAWELRINPAVWAQAHASLGTTGAAILVLIADANSVERQGTIRCVGGWVRRMAERADVGPLHLHRSIFGILHRSLA